MSIDYLIVPGRGLNVDIDDAQQEGVFHINFFHGISAGAGLQANDYILVQTNGENVRRIHAGNIFSSIQHNTLAGRTAELAHPGSSITLVTDAFDKNLDSSVDDVQKLAQAVDGLEVADIETVVAGETLSGHRFVTRNNDSKVIRASSTIPDNASAVLGMTKHAVVEDAEVEVLREGVITEAGWTWTTPRAPLFLTTDGLFSQTPPSEGFVLVVGYVVNTTTIFVKVGYPVFLV